MMVYSNEKRGSSEPKICASHCRDNRFGSSGFDKTLLKFEQPRPMVRARGLHEAAQLRNDGDKALGGNGC
ncbi:hypothetical protein BVI434_100019 [Burkholderia vietnamiensis]|nr:hypothetical protein BVI434_100019 [Burkholderia vietnamiensis]